MTQPLGLTHRDMIDQAMVDALNAEVKALLVEHDGQNAADTEIEAIADRHGFVVVEQDDCVTLVRDANDRYATIWYESEFGQAMGVRSPAQYDADAIGFDNQTLGWADAE